MLSEEEEIQALIDEAANSYKSVEEVLAEYSFTMEQALNQADAFRERFFMLLESKGIRSRSVSKIILELTNLLNIDRTNDTVFLYTAILTDNGLLFDDISDDEQKVLLWLEQFDKVRLLTMLIEKEPEYSRKLMAIKRYKPKAANIEINQKEQVLLYQMAIENSFLYKARSSNIFLENIGELVRQVNSNEIYMQIKPYIYYAVLSRKHKLMTERKHYTPNIPKVFDYQEYKIQMDNGKNFNTYQSYLELYYQLRCSYEDEIDVELTDYCMTNSSNLSEWYYENCEPNEDIPMSLIQTIDYFSTNIWLAPEYDDIVGFADENPVLTTAYQNEMSNEAEWQDFISAVQNDENITAYAERLYRKVSDMVSCCDSEKATEYAELYLYGYMSEYNRRLLVSAANNFTSVNGS